MFALVLPVLLGMLGLVIDGGLLIAAQRAAQNVADAAALAASMSALTKRGDPHSAATTFVSEYNGLSAACLTALNNPPAAGPHTGNSHYYEAIVTYPITPLFMPALRVQQRQAACARAVAGYERTPSGDTLGALDPSAAPGLSVGGGATLVVNGRVSVNALANPAAVVDGTSQMQAACYRIAGASITGAFVAYPGTAGTLHLNQVPIDDPFINLPTPAAMASGSNHVATPLSPGWSTRLLGAPNIADGSASGLVAPNQADGAGVIQLYPGVYESITVTGGVVKLNPGVYVLSPSRSSANALALTGGNITGTGVLFYNTGDDFDPRTGAPDDDDGALYDPGPGGLNAPPVGSNLMTSFASITIDASTADKINLTALSANGDPFDGFLIYQRRANTQSIKVNGGNLSLAGTIYAKWAPIALSGNASLQTQIIAAQITASGPATMTLSWANQFGAADKVFLTE
jgi:hypothetical protein